MELKDIMPLLNELQALGAHYDLSLTHKGIGRLWVSEVRTSDENYHKIMGALISFYGRLEKTVSDGTQSWKADKDGQQMVMYNVAQCKIVGHKTIVKKKTVEIVTDEDVTEEEPIYDCTGVE